MKAILSPQRARLTRIIGRIESITFVPENVRIDGMVARPEFEKKVNQNKFYMILKTFPRFSN